MSDQGFLSFTLRLLGHECISFRMEVDDFKTKWVIIAIAIGGLSLAAAPYIMELAQ